MNPVSKPINVSVLLEKIDFSPDNVVQAAAENSVLFVTAIDYRLQCLENKTAAKMAWEKIRAEKELKIREDARANGNKLTEGNIDALLLTNTIVEDFAKKLARTETLDIYSQLVVEAFRMRRDCLRIVENMVQSEYSMGRSIEAAAEKTKESRRRLKDRFPGE
jgi:hypothetical protein